MAFPGSESPGNSASASGQPEGSRSPPDARSCPHCGSKRVHRSHRRGPIERVLGLLGLKILRCHACNLRFAGFGGSVVLITDLERARRRLAALAVTLLVVAGMLWLMARQAAG